MGQNVIAFFLYVAFSFFDDPRYRENHGKYVADQGE